MPLARADCARPLPLQVREQIADFLRLQHVEQFLGHQRNRQLFHILDLVAADRGPNRIFGPTRVMLLAFCSMMLPVTTRPSWVSTA